MHPPQGAHGAVSVAPRVTHIFEIVGALRPRAIDDVRDALAAHQTLLLRRVLAGHEQKRLRHLEESKPGKTSALKAKLWNGGSVT